MDQFLLPILSSFILSVLFSCYCLPILLKSRKNGTKLPQIPPGNTGLPLIGETLDFLWAGKKGVPEKFVFDRMKKYSSKVFRTSLFGENVAVLCSAEANKFLYLNENKLVKSWWPRSVNAIFGPPGGNVSSLAAQSHQLFSPYLRPGTLENSVPIIDEVTKKHLKTYWQGKDVVITYPLLRRYTCTLACRLFLGIEDQETVTRMDKDFSEIVSGAFSMPMKVPGSKFNRAIKAKERLLKAFDVFLKRLRIDFSEGKILASKSVLREVLQQKFEDSEFRTKIFGLFFAAYDTTSSALSSIIMLMEKHPDVYHKVLEEQREITRSKGVEETLNLKDIQKMKYSWNVARESLRINSTGAGTFKEVICDFTYDGFFIPKGWKLHLNAYSTHRNSEYFKDPEKFDPTRFERDGLTPYSFIPFSGGPHMCPGRDYAKIIMLVFMHNTVTNFMWERVFPHEKFVCDPISKPEKDLPIRLYPHKF